MPPPKSEADLADRLFHVGAALNESNGAGWIVTIIEMMRAEWGCTLHQAMFKESLAAALVLWPAMLARNGVEVTFNHVDKARQQAKERAKAYLEANYTIVPR
jgi:hypothetical protein